MLYFDHVNLKQQVLIYLLVEISGTLGLERKDKKGQPE